MDSNLSRNFRGLRPMRLSVVAYRGRSGPANGVLIPQKSLTPVLVVRLHALARHRRPECGSVSRGKTHRPAPGYRRAAVGQQPIPWFRRSRAGRAVLPMRSAGACPQHRIERTTGKRVSAGRTPVPVDPHLADDAIAVKLLLEVQTEPNVA